MRAMNRYRADSESEPTPLSSADVRVRELLNQQAALRELAIAVAEMRPNEVIYELVAKEAAKVAGVEAGAIVRFRVDGIGEVVGSWRMGSNHTGHQIPLDGTTSVAVVAGTGRAARTHAAEKTDDRESTPSSVVSLLETAAVPVRVGRELWGALCVVAPGEDSLVPGVEQRLGIFADLVGLAITNTNRSDRLLSQATNDPLTGLLNHRAFQDRVESEVGRAKRYDRPLTVVLLDLDHFKSINDSYGHQAGDSTLMQAGRLLEDGARAGDVLGRIGGDEFALLLPETTALQALPIAERWAAAFRSAPVDVATHLTMSAGVCDLAHANGSRELLRLADSALYSAKSMGRDTVVLYSPETVIDISDNDRAESMQRAQALTAIRSLARLIDAKEAMNDDHSERVAVIARKLAIARGWPPARVTKLAEAAQIHDVGKVSVPEDLLRKPAALTGEEYELVKAHPALGAQLAHEVISPEQALWIEQHHERYDGTGYPNALAGPEISEGACLLALADSWDAMTSERCYSPAKSGLEALAECLSLAGRQFSPAACEALQSANLLEAS